MIHPADTELMDAINEEGNIEDEPLVTSRYSVVLASTAVEEIYQGKVRILPEDFQEEEETTEN